MNITQGNHSKTVKGTRSSTVSWNPFEAIGGDISVNGNNVFPSAGALGHEIGHKYLDWQDKINGNPYRTNREHHDKIVPDLEEKLSRHWGTGRRSSYNKVNDLYRVKGPFDTNGVKSNFETIMERIFKK